MNGVKQKFPITIAVVEDDESILDAVTLILENQEWDVAAYTSGEAFLLDLNQQLSPDLLVLDPHLPGMNGVEVVEHVSEKVVSLPIIVLTAHPNSEVTTMLADAGANEILVKPITEQVLLDNVRNALNSVARA